MNTISALEGQAFSCNSL